MKFHNSFFWAFIVNSSNRQKMQGYSLSFLQLLFPGKCELVLPYNRKTLIRRGFILKSAKINICLRNLHIVMSQLLHVLNVFITLSSKLIFWETETLFKTLEYRFLVESTTIKSAIFSYETALSKANFKKKRMRTTKWTYHKERSFATGYFIFLKV